MFYALYYGAIACFMPYIVLYYRQCGFSGGQIGLLTAISPLIGILAAPTLTGFADASRRYRLVMSLALGSGAVIAIIFPIVKTLLPMILLISCYAFLASPITALADNATMSMLAEEKEKYGRIRLGGTIGWAIAATIAGIVAERYGLKYSFWSAGALLFLGLLVSQGFVFSRPGEKVSIRDGVRTLLTRRSWVIFMAIALVAGIGFAALNNYFTFYMEQAGISKAWMGIAMALATISELPLMFFSNRLLKRFKARGLLMLAVASFGIRLLLYAASNNLAIILLFQLINGLTFPVFMVGAVSYAFDNAPPGMGATAQGIMGAMIFGFGSAAGGLLGGLLLGIVPARIMYAIIGVVLLLSLLLFLIPQQRSSQEATHG